tara:strand:- start:951 stop:1139 length:189 start_codon:yes stop_codon:yes gene_type:complete
MQVGDLVKFADQSNGGKINIAIVTDVKSPGGKPWLAQIHCADPANCDLWWPVERLEVIHASR